MIARFLVMNRVGRWLVARYHRHGTYLMGLRFGSGQNCWLCRIVWDDMEKHFPSDSFRDESSIKIRDTEYNEDGSVKIYGMSMTATAKRQLDAIMEKDPAIAAKIQEELEEIAKDPMPKNGSEAEVKYEPPSWSNN